MSFLQRIFGKAAPRTSSDPLYLALVAAAREPFWYREGGVPDSVDGRFDMVAAILGLILIRLESEGEKARLPSVRLTETFIADMDASLRQIGIGEYVVGKHVGRMMGALGGRLGALREARETGDHSPFVRRNIFHDRPVDGSGPDLVATRLAAFALHLDERDMNDIIGGRIPHP